MTTIIPEPSHVKRDPGQLVEMAWDPITRIVGSLGIYTKIDFDNREVVECHSTSSIFRGYSIFMKGKDPRDAHFITSRICGICGDNHCTCSCYTQNMAYGVQPPHLGEWLDQPRRSRGIHVRPQHLPGEPGRRGLLREDGLRDQSERARQGGKHRRLRSAGRARLSDDRRHHAGAQPVHRRLLPGGAAGQPVDARDVLPHGGQARAPVDAVSGRNRYHRNDSADDRLHDPADALRRVHEEGRADARRPVRLLLRGAARVRPGGSAAHAARLLGLVPGSRALQLRLQGHGELGPQDVRHAGRRRRRQARHDVTGRHQPRPPDPFGQFVLRRLDRPGDVRQDRSARQPGGSAPSLESAHQPTPAEA